jgi:hypothetical protein
MTPGSGARLVLVLAVGASACASGVQLGAGPVVGYAQDRGFSAGWEASGGPFTTTGLDDEEPTVGSLITRFSVGMAWRPSAGGVPGLEPLAYAAWEPWFLVGGTVGVVKVSSEPRPLPMVGLWEAAPYIGGGQTGTMPLPKCSPCYTLSIALGWRWSGASEFYLAPKLGFIDGATKPFPFSHYPD